MKSQRTIVKYFTFFFITGAAYILHITRSFMLPFAVAVLLSFLFIALAKFLERKRVPVILTNLVVFILITVIISGIGLLMYGSMLSIKNHLPEYLKQNREVWDAAVRFLEKNFDIAFFNDRDGMSFSDIFSFFSPGSLIAAVNTSFGSFIDFLSKVLLTLLFLILIFLSRTVYINKVMDLADAGKSLSGTNRDILTGIANQIQSYLWLKTLISCGTGLIFGLAAYLLGVDFYLVWGFLVFFLNYIPTIGPILATIPPVFIAVLQFKSVAWLITTTLIFVCIQVVSGTVIEPKIMGDRFNLNMIAVLLAIFIWGLIWGPFGMVLAVPIIASINIVFSNIPKYRKISVLLSR